MTVQAEVTQKADKQGRIRDRGWKGVIGWRPWLVVDQSCCSCGLRDARLFLLSCALIRVPRVAEPCEAPCMEHGTWSTEPSVFHQADTGCSGLAVDNGVGIGVDVDANMISIDACV